MNAEQLRELDAWIAEHVMGFRWARDVAEYRSDHPRGSKFKRGTRCLVHWSDLGKKEILGWVKASGREKLAPAWNFDVPHYATDPAAAMMVLEKCVTECDYEIVIDRKRTKKGPFRIETGKMGGPLAICDTLPLAICLFAKKLFEKQPNKNHE